MEKRNVIGLIIVAVLVAAGLIWYFVSRDNKETPTPVLSVSADKTQAGPGDTVVYTLNAENQSDEVIPGYIIEANISGIGDKATLIDASGASYNSGTNSLVWTPLDIQPHESISKQFSVRVNQLPANTAASSMNIKFNNDLTVNITSAPSGNNGKPAVAGDYVAPTTGVSEWVAVIFAAIVTLGIGFRKKLLGITFQN